MPQTLSRTEHEKITDDRLVRRRSQAKANAEAAGRVGGSNPRADVLGKVKAQAGMPAIGEEPDHPPPPQSSYVPPQQPPLRRSPGPAVSDATASAPHPHAPPPHHAQTLNAQGQAPPGQHPRQFSELKRYTLTDGPPAGYAPPAAGQRPPTSGSGIQPTRAQGRPPGRRHEAGPNGGGAGGQPGTPGPYGGPPNQGYPAGTPPPHPPPGEPSQPPASRPQATTFAELGFQAGKASEKDCIIM